ncbi:unnamed protein product [Cylindrotheca closterium]|uniref:Uncharacterized protein n=1 Tax=Cylindrotheca closterium TaxID=2856 RepID=A0AAD2PVK9_9STRA|nr:unnamed protein product [Cylindrotheca closterium]
MQNSDTTLSCSFTVEFHSPAAINDETVASLLAAAIRLFPPLPPPPPPPPPPTILSTGGNCSAVLSHRDLLSIIDEALEIMQGTLDDVRTLDTMQDAMDNLGDPFRHVQRCGVPRQ